MPRPAVPLASVLLLSLLAGCTSPLPPDQPGPPDPPPSDPVPDDRVDLDRRFVHEHATFMLFILGEQVEFTHQDYDLRERGSVRAHLHVTERNGGTIIHIEDAFPGGVPDVRLAEFFAIHGVGFRAGNLTLDTFDGHNGTSWADSGDARWEVWVEPASGPWALATDGPGLFLRGGQRVLVTYGASPEDLAAQQALVPVPPGRPAEQPA